MIEPRALFELLKSQGVDFYAGVPDSLLKNFCAYVTDHAPADKHVITANEGSAVALGAGYYLASGKTPLVYMQNSGLGNAVNPLTSLADPAVYGLPMLLMIGWRGQPGIQDEPQHMAMGTMMVPLLDAMGIEHTVMPKTLAEVATAVGGLLASIHRRCAPGALLVPKGAFAAYTLKTASDNPYAMSREHALGACMDALPAGALVVSTTGMPSREWFELRAQRKQSPDLDFLTVGSMGHASQIALGAAIDQPARQVVCIDGDGAWLMHMGGAATVGQLALKNYIHVVVNNGAHDSVGGQPTVGFGIDIPAVAKSCGYRFAASVRSEAELTSALGQLAQTQGPALLEIRVRTGARADLGRPSRSPKELKAAIRAALSQG